MSAESKFTASKQNGEPGSCFLAQVFGPSGEAIAQFEPTSPPSTASHYAELLAGVLNGSAWSPIATAPKNSTAKLVWCPERQNIYAVTWLAKRGWLVFGGGLLREQPTLWMPMPQSPPTDDFDDSSDSWPDDDDALCERCKGDGRDPMTDYLLPCPACQSEQH